MFSFVSALVYWYGFFSRLLILIFSVLAKRLAGKSIPEMTYLVSCGTLNFN